MIANGLVLYKTPNMKRDFPQVCLYYCLSSAPSVFHDSSGSVNERIKVLLGELLALPVVHLDKLRSYHDMS